MGEIEPPLEVMRRTKLQWFGTVTKKVPVGSQPHRPTMVEGGRGQIRPKNWLHCTVDDVKITECVEEEGDL